MLKIKSIKVSNFYSIGEISLPIEKGLHYIVGKNNDNDTPHKSSNGSGKTATFAAIYQGLFNKNVKNPKSTIDDVNNSITGKPYSIELEFDKIGSGSYKIINNRSNNKIIIENNGEEIQHKGIPAQLKQVKEIIGADFDTFSALTYISQSTLQAILDTTNKDNILYQFFNVETIHKANNLLKEEKKELKTTRTILITKLRSAEKSLDVLTSFQKIDVDELEKLLQQNTEALLEHEKNSRYTQLKALETSVIKSEESLKTEEYKLSEVKIKGSATKKVVDEYVEGKCPTCGSDYCYDITPHKEELAALKKEYTALEKVINEKKDSLKSIKEAIRKISGELSDERDAITDKINKVKSKILVVKEQNSQYDQIISHKEEITKEIDELLKEMDSLDVKLQFVEECLTLIKNGTLVNEYLNKFAKVFITVLKDLSEKTKFNINIRVSVKTGKLVYRFFDRGIEKGFNDLSAGERTRVSLVLLIATISTLEIVTGFSGNFLVIDEMFGVLDEEGIEMVKQFLEIVRETKAVYIITHHEEIPIEMFDTMITFVKDKNITKLEGIQKL
jgi:DNA repair exonuclease SbcCD ATPase subunit